jgi:hypothetical protein
MGTYKFSLVNLVWYDAQTQTCLPYTTGTTFNITAFRAHCSGHTAAYCRYNYGSGADHSPLQADHSFDVPPDPPTARNRIKATSRKMFSGFELTADFSLDLGDCFHSSTSGSGTQWVPNDLFISHKLLENSAAISKPGQSAYKLFLEMNAEAMSIEETFLVEGGAQLDHALLVAPEDQPFLVVQLSRSRSVIKSVQAIVPTAGKDAPTSLRMRPTSDSSSTFVVRSPLEGTSSVKIKVEFEGEPPTILAPPVVLPLRQVVSSTPQSDYDKRRAEIAAEGDRDRRHLLEFFLDIDVQFRCDMQQEWRPLTLRDHGLAALNSATWKERRERMIQRQTANAANLVTARRHARDEAELCRTLRRYAKAYAEPDAWDEALYRLHLDELALGQEAIVIKFFSGGSDIDLVNLEGLTEAFELFASGELRSRDEDLAFRNGEPDSSYMFFWAEFADEVIRWLGPEGANLLTPERLWFWEGFRRCLVLAAEVYRRHYKPGLEGDPVGWAGYSASSFRSDVHPELPRPAGDPTEFGAWRDLLRRAFPRP